MDVGNDLLLIDKKLHVNNNQKTSFLLEIIGTQMKLDPNFVALWVESEESITQEHLKLFNIDKSRFVFFNHEREGAAEDLLDRVEAAIATGAIDMCCINSLKCLVPAEEFKKQMGEHTIGLQARMNSKLMRKYTSLVAENDTVFAIVTHLTTQIGGMMMRDPLTTAGGRAIRYAAMLHLEFRKNSIAPEDPITKEEGMKISVTCKKNHCNPSKNVYGKAQYFVIYGEGTETILEVMEACVSKGILVKSGAFIKEIDSTGNVREEDGVKYQWQGKAAFRNYCKENPEYFNYLLSKVDGSFVETLTEEEIEQIKQEEAEIKQAVGAEMDDIIAEANKKQEDKKTKSKKKDK